MTTEQEKILVKAIIQLQADTVKLAEEQQQIIRRVNMLTTAMYGDGR